MSTVSISHAIDADEFWSSVMGSGWETYTWWQSVAYIDDSDWNVPGSVAVTIDNPEGAGVRKATIDVAVLAAAWNTLVAADHRDACTGRRFDIEDVDACVGDAVMQHAVLGEVVYG